MSDRAVRLTLYILLNILFLSFLEEKKDFLDEKEANSFDCIVV